MKKRIITLSIILIIISACFSCLCLNTISAAEETEGKISYLDSSEKLDTLMDTATSFIVVKHSPLGASHYAYTEALFEETGGDASPEGTESLFKPGSQLILMTLEKENGKVKETMYTLLDSKSGCIRDPDVSSDGKRVVFSWKQKNNDDFHLYEMNIDTRKYVQLTFGSGIADTEPQYLPNGEILFSSTRAIQTVDCWKTPVSNLYKCSSDGSNIVRLTYDQVHDTYATTTEDGRIVYTRWDYNDRTQMFVQGVFQMNPDGTNQTELYGNDASFPTTLVHTRNVPGSSDLYVSIATGHHTYQAGKFVMLDLSDGRESSNAVTFINPDRYCNKPNDYDTFGQEGALYQYPYAINDELFLVSYSKTGWSSNKDATPFSIVLMDRKGNPIELVSGKDSYPCANIIPIKNRDLHIRPSSVDYSKNYGTYYVANVYDGDGAKGIAQGSIEYIRVVGIEYRPYSIGGTVASGSGSADVFTPISTGNGSWDIKTVYGLAKVYEDGSALFNVPSETPLYFQLLDKNGCMVQTMRSWSTLQPGEIYSCVGCHEDKNTTPGASTKVTLALKAGISELIPDVWQDEDFDPYKDAEGYDYLKEVQPIFDNKCVSCHNNKNQAYNAINASAMNNSGATAIVSGKETVIFNLQETWKYYISASNNAQSGWNKQKFDDSSWSSGKAGFGDRGGDGAKVGTNWNGSSNYIFIRKTFNITDVSKYSGASIRLNTWYDDTVKYYLNGQLIYSDDNWIDSYQIFDLGTSYSKYLVEGENVLAISVNQHTGGRFIDTSLSLVIPDGNDPTASNPISLENTLLFAGRMRRYFPLSYLVLTGSKPQSGNQWVGTPNNKYISWMRNMSGATLQKAGSTGSIKSSLIQMLREGHADCGITENEIRTISAWIDLSVPCYGRYDANNSWSQKADTNAFKEATEEQNKRDYYSMLDRYSKMALSDTLPNGIISVKLTNGKTELSAEGKGIAMLLVDRKYKNGDTITVTLPEGIKYFGLTINSKMGESIIYCPDGEFTYKITSAYLSNLFPTYVYSSGVAYNQNYVTVRIPTNEELSETRNIAKNAFDINEKKASAYPHATSDSEWEDSANDVRFLARNAIDGFEINTGHGAYPLQSWGPANSNNHYLNIDFGREVTVDEIGIFIRFDQGHDTFFKSGTLEFSDGTRVNFKLEFIGTEQIIKLDKPIKTTYVKISKLVAEKSGGWAALSEVNVYGQDILSE